MKRILITILLIIGFLSSYLIGSVFAQGENFPVTINVLSSELIVYDTPSFETPIVSWEYSVYRGYKYEKTYWLVNGSDNTTVCAPVVTPEHWWLYVDFYPDEFTLEPGESQMVHVIFRTRPDAPEGSEVIDIIWLE